MYHPLVERPAVESGVFRGVMRRWASGVTVVTVHAGGEVRGITMSSFTSLSLEPPLVLVCMDKRAYCHGMAIESGRYCVNLLAETQRRLSDRFAGRHGPEQHARFDDCSSAATPTGEPILDDALGYFDCRIVATHDGGDHTIFVGLVEGGGARPGPARPLTFFDAHYRHLAPPDPYEAADPVPDEVIFEGASL